MTLRHGRGAPSCVTLTAALLLAAAESSAAAPRRYLVMPFENLSAERSLNWLSEALASSLADRFELLGMRTVTREERVQALDSLAFPPGTQPTLASTLRLAAAVRASRFVTGSYTYDPKDGVVVSARLLDVDAARQIWGGKRPGTLAGIFSLMDPLALEGAVQDDSRVSVPAPSTLGSISDPPLPLYEILVRGIQEPDPDRRVATLEKGLVMNRLSPALLKALAFEMFDAGRLDEALSRLDQIPEASCPDGWRLQLLRGRILAAQGNPAGAVAALSRSIAAAESPDAHLLLARLHAAAGEKASAGTEIDLAAGLDPEHPELAEVRALLQPPPGP